MSFTYCSGFLNFFSLLPISSSNSYYSKWSNRHIWSCKFLAKIFLIFIAYKKNKVNFLTCQTSFNTISHLTAYAISVGPAFSFYFVFHKIWKHSFPSILLSLILICFSHAVLPSWNILTFLLALLYHSHKILSSSNYNVTILPCYYLKGGYSDCRCMFRSYSLCTLYLVLFLGHIILWMCTNVQNNVNCSCRWSLRTK